MSDAGGSNFGSGMDIQSAGAGGGQDAAAPPPASSPAPSSGNTFGAGIFGYKVDPQADYLDQQASTIQQRLQRAQSIATNPFVAIFNPEGRAAAMDYTMKAPQALLQVQQQKATINANKQEAVSLGFSPGEVPDVATHEQRIEFAKQKALTGNLKVYQGLAAVDPKAAESIADQVHEVMGGHLDNAQAAFDKLSAMSNQGQYTRAVQALRSDGTLTDLEKLGLKVPDSYGDFKSAQAGEGKALRDARIGLNDAKTKLEQRNSFEDMPEAEQKSYAGRNKTVYGDVVDGPWARRQADGARGQIVPGLSDPRNLGNGAAIATPDQRKELKEGFEQAVPKEDLEKYRSFNRTYQMATHDDKGQPVAAGTINTNPNVQQGIAESLASTLRGGSGGANVGLLKVEMKKRGWTQGAIDDLASAYAGGVNTIGSYLGGKPDQSYQSPATQTQVRDVLEFLKNYNDTAMGDRVGRLAQRAGALGLDSSTFGLGEKEAGGLNDAVQQGRDAQVADWMQKGKHQAIGGGDGAIILGAQNVGTGAARLPPGTTASTTQPGRPALPTPAGQNGPQPLPGGPAPTRPGGSPNVSAAPPAGGGPPPVQPNPAPSGAPSGGQPFPAAGPNTPLEGPSGAPPLNDVVTKAFQAFAAHNGGTDEQAQAVAARVMANPRVTKKLEAGQVPTEKDLAGAAGAGGNKTLLQHLRGVLDTYLTQGATAPRGAGDIGGALREGQAVQSQATRAAASGAAGNAAVENAPAIGGTVGAIAGAAGGPAGSVAGGGLGSGAGQAFKDYMQGREQSPARIAKETALGGVLGVAAEGRPIVSAALRAAGAAGVEGGAAAAGGEGGAQSAAKATLGAGEALGGEAFGRALGMVGHKVWGLFSSESKTLVQGAAKDLVEARATLDTAEPKIAGATGAVDNPAYKAAEQKAEKAETVLKDAGLKPEEAAYAYKATSEAVPKQEAQVTRPAAAEKAAVGQGYQQLQSDVNAAGVGAPKATPKLSNGPIAVATAMPAKHQEIAQRAEAAITAPAASWGDKWSQLKDVRSGLLTAERDALTSTAPGRTQVAKDMRTLADSVRVQQEKVANHVFGEEGGKAQIAKLKVLDDRYRNLMDATNNGDIMSAAKLTGEAGREADRKFRAFAAGDPAAIAAWNGLRGPKSNVEKDVRTLVGAEGIPYFGKVVSAVKMASGFKEWLAERAAGSPVKFADLLPPSNTGAANRTVRNIAGSAGRRAVLQ